MAHDDNVIDAGAAFRRKRDETTPGPQGEVTRLVREAVAGGDDPRALLGALMSAGWDGPDPFARPTPTLLARRAEPVTYRVRVDLDDARPPIWRRLDLPSDLTLDVVHAILQVAMGWADTHLHCFRMGPDAKDFRMTPFLTPFDVEEGERGIPESDVRLDEVLATPGQRLFYEYDFGDSWSHTVKLEKVLPLGPVGCVGGRRACPPEDCGGLPGYEMLLESPQGTDDDLLDGLGPDFDPDEFDVEATNEDVRAVAEGRLPGLPDLAPAVVDLMERAAGTPAEGHLATLLVPALADAPGGFLDDDGDGPDPDVVDAATRPLRALLDVVGDGVDLTGAGRLRPAQVSELFTALDMGEGWIGAGNREDLTPPVADLRQAGQYLGLIRKHGARLLPTPAGRALRGDPDGLWRHTVDHLPAGTTTQQTPATLLLLAVAGGISPRMTIGVEIDMLRAIGWRGGSFTERQLVDARIPTWTVLLALGAFENAAAEDVTDLGMDLATAALVRG